MNRQDITNIAIALTCVVASTIGQYVWLHLLFSAAISLDPFWTISGLLCFNCTVLGLALLKT